MLTTILMITLIVGVYAGMRLSNILTAQWIVRESQGNLVLSWYWNEPTGDLNRGQWYYTQVRLQNIGETTYNVIVKFKVWIYTDLPENSIRVQGDWGTGWQDIAFREWDSGLGRYVYVGTWGPPSGFQCTPGWDVVTTFRYMFEASAPIDVTYYFNAWVEEVP